VLVIGDENKAPSKHVEADTDVVSGRGFDSPRLQISTPLQRAANCRPAQKPVPLPRISGVFLFPAGFELPWPDVVCDSVPRVCQPSRTFLRARIFVEPDSFRARIVFGHEVGLLSAASTDPARRTAAASSLCLGKSVHAPPCLPRILDLTVAGFHVVCPAETVGGIS